MASTQPLTDAITALTTYANGVTGASDTTLSDAVRTLADGYGQGGGSAIHSDVNFYDYDGELVYSYTAEDFLALSEMPSAPSHDGLVSTGWNWDLADAQEYVGKYGALEVGHTYTTDDETQHMHVNIPTDQFEFTFTAPVGWVDWGDGSDRQTISANGSVSHTYADAGNYIIKIYNTNTSWILDSPPEPDRYTVEELNFSLRIGNYDQTNKLMDMRTLKKISFPSGGNTTGFGLNYGRNAMIRAVILPKNATAIGQTGVCYAECISYPKAMTKITSLVTPFIKQVTFPDVAVAITGNGTGNCYCLERVIIPDNITGVTAHSFLSAPVLHTLRLPSTFSATGTFSGRTLEGVRSLKRLSIPEGVESLYSGFTDLFNCEYLELPSTLTAIANNSIQGLYSCREIHVKAETPPTINATSALNNVPSWCKIYVPYSADHSILEAYKTATNWARYADLMLEETA